MDVDGCKLLCSFKKFPSNLVHELRSPQLLSSQQLPKKVLTRIRDSCITMKHLLEIQDGCSAVLERYYSQYWVLWHLDCPLKGIEGDFEGASNTQVHKYQDKSLKSWLNYSVTDFIRFWGEDICNYEHSNEYEAFRLNMTPSTKAILTCMNTKLADTPLDPDHYLSKKYSEFLFKLKTPISFFVESKLSRLRIICNNDDAYKTVIENMLLDHEEFDIRHDISVHGLVSQKLSSYENSLRDRHIIERFSLKGKEENNKLNSTKKDLMIIIKAREIKLQIILLLELIALTNLDDKLRNFEFKYKKSFEKRLLNISKSNLMIRKRNRLRSKKDHSKRILDFCERLDLFLDKLAIIDIMLSSEPTVPDDNVQRKMMNTNHLISEIKYNMLNKGKEISGIGFLSYVLIPYWSRRIPNTVAFIEKKIKGPNIYNISSENKNSHQVNIEDQIELSKHSFVSLKIHSTAHRSPRDSLPSDLHDVSIQSIAKSRTHSNLGELLCSDNSINGRLYTLSKSKTDMTFDRLQRRQLPVSDFKALNRQTTTLKPKDQSHSISYGNSTPNSTISITQSFQRVGKRKFDKLHATEPSLIDKTTIQVMATPARLPALKKDPNSGAVVKSPLFEPCHKPMSASLGVAATPIKMELLTKSKSNIILATPIDGSVSVKNSVSKTPEIQYNTATHQRASLKPKKVRRKLFPHP